MKHLQYLVLLCAVCALSFFSVDKAQAKVHPVPTVYMFGFSASFADSTIYFTDIQTIDSVWYDEKISYIEARPYYSQQLKDYFAASMMPNRVCIVIYALTKKEIEKKYLKMKRLYSGDKKHASYDILYLTTNEFQFKRFPHEEQ